MTKEKFIYEFITPSDPITFIAYDDKVAFACAVLLGNGKAGAKRYAKNESVSIPSMVAFSGNPEEVMNEFTGGNFDEFFKANKPAIKECFLSFAYGDIESRRTYDDAILAITEPEKLEQFKALHENRNRTSMSKWVQRAWNIGKNIELNDE